MTTTKKPKLHKIMTLKPKAAHNSGKPTQVLKRQKTPLQRRYWGKNSKLIVA